MAKKIKGPAVAVKVPQNRDEASAFIGDIGKLQRARLAAEAAMNEELAATKARYEAATKAAADRITALRQGLEVWCAANRQCLTDGGKTKTVTLAAGVVRWRMTPPAVALKSVKDVLAALKEKGLVRFIRTKEEVNKEAILDEPEAAALEIPGITIVQQEEFVVVPFETKLEEVA